MNDTSLLRKTIHEALRAGDLPNRQPTRTWGGRGSGQECKFCAEVIGPDDMELELEFGSHGGGQAEQGFCVHVHCFSEWQELRAASEQ